MAQFFPFIIEAATQSHIEVTVTRMKKADAAQTVQDPAWRTSYIQDPKFQKICIKDKNRGGELVALAAYEILESDVMVHITYVESQEVKVFVEEATRVAYEQDKARRNGAPLESVKPFFGEPAC